MIADKPKSYRSAALVGACLLAAGSVLFFFNPNAHAFYPRCPLFVATGLLCAGCGSLRALHQLSHGHFAEAFQLNPLLILALPIVGYVLLASWMRRTGRANWPAIFDRPVPLAILVVAVIAFSIVRNLPGFAWLRP